MKVNINIPNTNLVKAHATKPGFVYSINSFLYLRLNPNPLLRDKMPENTILFLNIGPIGTRQAHCCATMLDSHLDMEYVGEPEIKLA